MEKLWLEPDDVRSSEKQ